VHPSSPPQLSTADRAGVRSAFTFLFDEFGYEG
jgi:hypothetical protein